MQITVCRIWHWCTSLHPFHHINNEFSIAENKICVIFFRFKCGFQIMSSSTFLKFSNFIEESNNVSPITFWSLFGGFKVLDLREVKHEQKKYIFPPIACKQCVTKVQRALWVGPTFYHWFLCKFFVPVQIIFFKIIIKFILKSLKWASSATQHCTMSICNNIFKN